MKILFVSYHHFFSPNRAGFHFLALAMKDLGHDVHFLTSGSDSTFFGFLRFLRRDRSKAPRSLKVIRSAFFPYKMHGLTQTSWFSLIHTPNNFHRFRRALTVLYHLGFSRAFFTPSGKPFDVVVFESSQGLMLFDRIARRFPRARLIYRVSDDLVMLDNNPALIEAEARALGRFHLVSTPSTYITHRLKSVAPAAAPRIKDHTHAIHKDAFAGEFPNPYSKRNNLLFVGLNPFDFAFLELAAAAKPDYHFHLIGSMERRIQAPNIHYYGILPFEKVLPYMVHADIGLQTLAHVKNVEVYERTLKYVQYTLCRIPIVAPAYLNLPDAHVFKYELNRESVERALDGAMIFDRKSIDRSWVKDYRELAAQLLTE